MKIWNIEIDDKIIKETVELFEEHYFINEKIVNKGKKNQHSVFYPKIDKSNLTNEFNKLKSNIETLYHKNELGYKSIVMALDNEHITYSSLRTVFKKLGITPRTGTSTVTKTLCKMRSYRSTVANPWTNWTEKYPMMHKGNKSYCQGYYFNESMNKDVWLRSSWEYGYAQYLDKRKENWDVECRSYLLSDGRYYRPDFFIFDDKNKLIKIVEIKANYNKGSAERITRYETFKKEYEIQCELICEELFDIIDISYGIILKQWKEIRKESNE